VARALGEGSMASSGGNTSDNGSGDDGTEFLELLLLGIRAKTSGNLEGEAEGERNVVAGELVASLFRGSSDERAFPSDDSPGAVFFALDDPAASFSSTDGG